MTREPALSSAIVTRAIFALPSRIRNVFAAGEKANPFGALTPYSLVCRERTTQRGAELPCASTDDRTGSTDMITSPIKSIKRIDVPLNLSKLDIIYSPHNE